MDPTPIRALAPHPMLTLLKNVDIHAPEPLGVGDVLLAGGRIASVGPSLDLGTTPHTVVDGTGLLAIPGLVDCHAHLSGGGGEGGAHTRVPPVHLSDFTLAGVTTAIGLLGTDATTRHLPELLAAARGLAHFGLTTFTYTGAYEVPPPTITGSVRGDITHVDRIVAVGELAISDHRSSQPTFDELARIAADAHVAGLMTGKAGLVHLHLGDGKRGLELVRRIFDETELPVRTLHPTHCNRNPDLWKEALELHKSHGAWIDVTAFPEGDPAPSAADCIAEFLKNGDPAKITCSSDGGGCLPTFDPDGNLVHMDVGRPDTLLQTVWKLTTGGVPLENALRPVTRNPAELFRLHGKGRIAEGNDADVVLVDPDLAVHHTFAGGHHLVREKSPIVRSIFEGA